MASKNPVSIPLLFLICSASARAECPILKEVLTERSTEVTAFSARNEQMMASVTIAEKDCHEQGAKISTRIAKAAESLSCQAQRDAAEINREMERIGVVCTAAFQKRHELQILLHTDFNKLIADVDDGVGYILKSEILNEECLKEVKLAKKLHHATHVTESSIVATELRSLAAMDSYEKFSATSAQLKKQTESRNVACGQQPSIELSNPPTGVPGRSVPVVISAGKAPQSASSITGRIEDQRVHSGVSGSILRGSFNKAELGHENARYPEGTLSGLSTRAHESGQNSHADSALEDYNRSVQLPAAARPGIEGPMSGLESTVLFAFSLANEPELLKNESATGTLASGNSLEVGLSMSPETLPATRSGRSLASVAPGESGVQFLGELTPDAKDGQAVDVAGITIFQQVSRVYRSQEQAMATEPHPAKVAMGN